MIPFGQLFPSRSKNLGASASKFSSTTVNATNALTTLALEINKGRTRRAEESKELETNSLLQSLGGHLIGTRNHLPIRLRGPKTPDRHRTQVMTRPERVHCRDRFRRAELQPT